MSDQQQTSEADAVASASSAGEANATIITFERVGRHRDVAPLTITDGQMMDADEIAYHVRSYAMKFLGSNDVEVAVNLEAMRGAINWGRFGSFTITEDAS